MRLRAKIWSATALWLAAGCLLPRKAGLNSRPLEVDKWAMNIRAALVPQQCPMQPVGFKPPPVPPHASVPLTQGSVGISVRQGTIAR